MFQPLPCIRFLCEIEYGCFSFLFYSHQSILLPSVPGLDSNWEPWSPKQPGTMRLNLRGFLFKQSYHLEGWC